MPQSRVIDALLRADGGELKPSELETATGYSRPTIRVAIQQLVASGWIVELSSIAERPGRGRPPRTIRVDLENAIFIALDIHQNVARLAVADLLGHVLASASVESAAWTADERLARIFGEVTRLREAFPTAELLSITIGAPGIITSDGRITLSPALPDWNGLAIRSVFESEFDVPVLVENNAHLAAFGEFQRTLGARCENFVHLVTDLDFTAAGIVLGGSLFRGSSGAAGTVGELDALRWTTGPQRLAARLRDLGHDPRDPESFYSALERNEPEETDAFQDYIDDIALGLAALCLAFDPEVIAVSGVIARAGQPALEQLERALQARAHLVSPRVEASALGESAMLTGAAEFAIADARAKWFSPPS